MADTAVLDKIASAVNEMKTESASFKQAAEANNQEMQKIVRDIYNIFSNNSKLLHDITDVTKSLAHESHQQGQTGSMSATNQLLQQNLSLQQQILGAVSRSNSLISSMSKGLAQSIASLNRNQKQNNNQNNLALPSPTTTGWFNTLRQHRGIAVGGGGLGGVLGAAGMLGYSMTGGDWEKGKKNFEEFKDRLKMPGEGSPDGTPERRASVGGPNIGSGYGPKNDYNPNSGTAVSADLTPEARALLDTIHGSESAYAGDPYTVMFGGSHFKGYDDHPRQYFRVPWRTDGKPTSAAGRYQFTATTWDDAVKVFGDQFKRGPNGKVPFTPENQDKMAWLWAQYRYQNYGKDKSRDLQADLADPNKRRAALAFLSREWTSLPGGSEPNAKTNSRFDAYDKALEAAKARQAGSTVNGQQPSINGTFNPRTGKYETPDGTPVSTPNVVEAQDKATVRKQPITPELKEILDYAAEKAGLTVEVFSGGQTDNHDPRTKGIDWTGSHRHDNGKSADIYFRDKQTGRKLDSNNPEDRARMAEATKHAVAAGATGVGAGNGLDSSQPGGYMGPHGVHIGFGDVNTWGAKGYGAPDWLRDAHRQGLQMQKNNADFAAYRERKKAEIESAYKKYQEITSGKPDAVPEKKEEPTPEQPKPEEKFDPAKIKMKLRGIGDSILDTMGLERKKQPDAEQQETPSKRSEVNERIQTASVEKETEDRGSTNVINTGGGSSSAPDNNRGENPNNMDSDTKDYFYADNWHTNFIKAPHDYSKKIRHQFPDTMSA